MILNIVIIYLFNFVYIHTGSSHQIGVTLEFKISLNNKHYLEELEVLGCFESLTPLKKHCIGKFVRLSCLLEHTTS